MAKTNKKKATSKLATELTWTTQAMFHAIVFGEEKTLAIFVSPSVKPGEWQVAAIETPTANAKSGSAQAVFDEHAHKIVGAYSSPSRALHAAEGFAESWSKKHKAASFREVCTCDEIDSACPHVVEEENRAANGGVAR